LIFCLSIRMRNNSLFLATPRDEGVTKKKVIPYSETTVSGVPCPVCIRIGLERERQLR
jgi:hypothetical protein